MSEISIVPETENSILQMFSRSLPPSLLPSLLDNHSERPQENQTLLPFVTSQDTAFKGERIGDGGDGGGGGGGGGNSSSSSISSSSSSSSSSAVVAVVIVVVVIVVVLAVVKVVVVVAAAVSSASV